MKYLGILSIVSVMATFTAFSPEANAWCHPACTQALLNTPCVKKALITPRTKPISREKFIGHMKKCISQALTAHRNVCTNNCNIMELLNHIQPQSPQGNRKTK